MSRPFPFLPQIVLAQITPPGFAVEAIRLKCLRILRGEVTMKEQTLVAELTVEALHVAVFHRASGRDEVQLHLVFVGPLIDHLAGKLGAVVDHNRVRFAASGLQFFQHPHYPQPRQRGVHLDA